MYFLKYLTSTLVCFFVFVFAMFLFWGFCLGFFGGEFYYFHLFSGTAIIDFHAVVFYTFVFVIIHTMEELVTLLQAFVQVLG